ncbi:MAG: mechanosensitive ion channel [Thaumarchaeota archaeon]|nr:MAG: mechanosensitive ion channel [Nitrososphaerota archaeon]
MNSTISLLMDNEEDKQHKQENNTELNKSSSEKKGISLVKSLMTTIIIVTAIAIVSSLIGQLLDPRYSTFLKVGVVATIGYFVINSVANVFYKLSYDALKKNAEIIRILIRIIGAIIIISIIISYLSEDPIIAASIATITGVVIGFASQNVIGNLISGLYLAITRPFRIGDKATVFGNTGIIFDIGLLYTSLRNDEGHIILAPNLSMVSTTIIIRDSKSV